MELVNELPSYRGGRVDWKAMEIMARDNPGVWVKSDVSMNPSVATQMKAGQYASVNPEGLEIATRRDPDDASKSFVYFRVSE